MMPETAIEHLHLPDPGLQLIADRQRPLRLCHQFWAGLSAASRPSSQLSDAGADCPIFLMHSGGGSAKPDQAAVELIHVRKSYGQHSFRHLEMTGTAAGVRMPKVQRLMLNFVNQFLTILAANRGLRIECLPVGPIGPP
jgi:hypothetical protein